jgi:pimeloyl-ACP methyl ester carboxylesterase
VAVDLSFSETGAGRPLVILHGLFGSKRNWASIAAALAAHRRVVTVDLRNHGQSPWADRHDYPALADDVAGLIREHVGTASAVLGHSMGGKVAMVLALAAPELVERLVVVDIAPARSQSDSLSVLRAMRAVPLATCARRADVENALAADIPDRAVRGFVAHNVRIAPQGLSWGVNLDALERHADDILGFPRIPDGQRFDKPTLFIAGARADYIRPEHHAEIRRLFPLAAIETIANAGHWVHADAPQAFLDVVTRFLTA